MTVGIDIEIEIMVERGTHRFALGHSELVEYVENVVSLRDHYPDWCPNYFDTEEVVELMQVFHFEPAG